MILGTDNVYVPLNENDVGSIIAYTLASNVYKEAMIKTNYMDISHKIKGISKHTNQSRGNQSITGNLNNLASDIN